MKDFSHPWRHELKVDLHLLQVRKSTRRLIDVVDVGGEVADVVNAAEEGDASDEGVVSGVELEEVQKHSRVKECE